MDALFGLGYTYAFLGQYEKSLSYYEQWSERQTELSYPFSDYLLRVGYSYYMSGYTEKAKDYFNKQIEVSNKVLNLGVVLFNEVLSYYNNAGIYAFLGEKDKAFENLRQVNQSNVTGVGIVTLLSSDPMFDPIRDEPYFQQIILSSQ